MFLIKQFVKSVLLPPTLWMILLLAVLIFWPRKWARKLLVATFVLINYQPRLFTTETPRHEEN
jgi:hypothetical protein